jgi:hypothetical protein
MTTTAPKITDQILALAATELRRLESENNSWIDAYSGLSLVDGDIFEQKLGGIHDINHRLPRTFPKGYWIVYLQHKIRRSGSTTIMAFSKKDLSLVYFGSADDNGYG